MQKPNWKRALVSIASAMTLTGLPTSTYFADAQENGRAVSVPAGLQDPNAFQSTPIQYLPFAHFAIPFDIDRTGKLPQEVRLWVSADQGRTWLPYATNSPDKRSFEFQAAAEGEYLFAVQTQDDRGASALAAAPPMRILVDTTKPQVQLSADINSAGRLVIDYRIEDRYLSEDSVRLSYAVDGRSQWEEVRVGRLTKDGDAWSGRIEQEMPRCHELELKLVASDLAQNNAETTARYHAPRTAAAATGMQLASQRAQPKTPTLGQREPTPIAAAPNITPQLSGPRAIANRMSQLAGALPPVAAKVTEPASPQTATSQTATLQTTTSQTTTSQTRASQLTKSPLTNAPSSTSAGGTMQSLESPTGAIAWEPTTSRRPVATTLNPQPLGRTVSNPIDDGHDQALELSSEPATTIASEPMAAMPSPRSAEELPRPSAVEDGFPVFQHTGQARHEQSRAPIALQTPMQLELAEPNASSTQSSPALNSVLERAEAAHNTPTSPVTVPPVTVPPASSPYATVPSATVPSAIVPSAIVPSATLPAANAANSVEGSIPPVRPAPVTKFNATDSAVEVGDAPRPTDGDGLPTIVNDAYHSRSRSFSLDYSVEALRGLAISDIELWGTDDRGNSWLKWGSDPDRESPFDVQVATDGLYGFRMVIIGQNGLISNRPSDGDPADMWINVDTKIPSVKITRALYGEGPDAGMLVIDYSCDDENLHDRPISLAYSERPTGPWSTIVTGLRNTGIYLWKADPNLPQQVYLRIQAVDRAGNVQEHRLELPINLRGLTPRGRIQGFRPIDPKP